MRSSRLVWQLFLPLAGILVASQVTLIAISYAIARPTWVTGLSSLGIIGLSLALAYIFTIRSLHPVDQLAQRVQRLAGLDTSALSLAARNDEWHALGQALEQIAERLEDRLVQLQLYSERLSTVLGSMVEGVLAVDEQERILLANEASRQMLEIPGQDVVGRSLLEVTRNRALHETAHRAVERQMACEAEIVSLGGTRRALSLRATPFPGSPARGVVLVLHDVTELRRLESLRRDFVANVSHELKTPLASIKAFAETLRLGAIHDAEHNLQFVARIEEQANRLHQLIVDLLHLARVEAGTEVFEPTRFSLAEVAELCVAEQAARAEARGLTMQLYPPAEEVFVHADFEGVRTILDNLLANAINYTPSGGIIRLRWFARHQEGVVEVEDTGLGIAPHHQQRIFERFYRVDRARSREMGGTGLGLAIVKHLAQALHGGVSLRSELGKGSTFTVWLPRARSEDSAT